MLDVPAIPAQSEVHTWPSRVEVRQLQFSDPARRGHNCCSSHFVKRKTLYKQDQQVLHSTCRLTSNIPICSQCASPGTLPRQWHCSDYFEGNPKKKGTGFLRSLQGGDLLFHAHWKGTKETDALPPESARACKDVL